MGVAHLWHQVRRGKERLKDMRVQGSVDLMEMVLEAVRRVKH
jgi:hypothetical protein